MADLDDLEADARVKEAEVVDDRDSEDMAIYNDLHDSFVFLNQAMHLLAYLGDVSLKKSVTVQDRKVMESLSDSIKAYLDETEGQYNEG